LRLSIHREMRLVMGEKRRLEAFLTLWDVLLSLFLFLLVLMMFPT
jgi:hypothetical protein